MVTHFSVAEGRPKSIKKDFEEVQPILTYNTVSHSSNNIVCKFDTSYKLTRFDLALTIDNFCQIAY